METSPSPPVITLLTDFGSNDYFVGSLHGVILNINPRATIVDLTHEVAAFSIAEAAFLLRSCYAYFPEGSIHVAVVDPGVGSGRRPLLVHAGGFYFLAPDNGLLSYVYRDAPTYRLIELTETTYHLPAPGNSFQGRDVFAPVAAWLSRGRPAHAFGRKVHDPVTLPLPVSLRQGDTIEGEVIYIDRFGNLITNVTAGDVDAYAPRDQLDIAIGDVRCRGIAGYYAQGSGTNPHGLVNSLGHLEIFLYQNSAAKRLGVSIGMKVTVTRC